MVRPRVPRVRSSAQTSPTIAGRHAQGEDRVWMLAWLPANLPDTDLTDVARDVVEEG